jgi:hypothetical protein
MITDHGPDPCGQNVGKPADTGNYRGRVCAGLLDAGGRAETLVDDKSAQVMRHAV